MMTKGHFVFEQQLIKNQITYKTKQLKEMMDNPLVLPEIVWNDGFKTLQPTITLKEGCNLISIVLDSQSALKPSLKRRLVVHRSNVVNAVSVCPVKTTFAIMPSHPIMLLVMYLLAYACADLSWCVLDPLIRWN